MWLRLNPRTPVYQASALTITGLRDKKHPNSKIEARADGLFFSTRDRDEKHIILSVLQLFKYP
jgi:hypothetical protein